jgi:hypothetical protein
MGCKVCLWGNVTEFELSDSYATLSASPAFRHLLEWLTSQVSLAEGEALLEQNRRSRAITKWQERRKIVLGIEALIEEQAAIRAAQLEEMEHERAIERDRAGRSGW